MFLYDIYRNFTNNFKLRYKLLLAYLMIAIIPIVIVGELSYARSERFMINQAVSSLEMELVQVTEDINYKLDLSRRESDLLLYDRQFNKILSTNYSNDLNKLNEVYIDIIMPKFAIIRAMQTDIKVYTMNESLLLGNRNIFSISDIKDNPQYENILQGEQSMVWHPVSTLAKSNYLNNSFYLVSGNDDVNTSGKNNKLTYEKVLTLSRGIFDTDSKIQAIIDVYLPVSMVEKVLSNINLPDNGAGAYYDSYGNIVVAFGSASPDKKNVSNILQENRTFGSIEEKDKIMVFRKTLVNNGTIVVSYPMSYITGRVGVIKNITHWTVIISILSVILISYLLANLITRRLDRLMDKIKLIRDTGKTNTAAAIPGNDEIAKIDKMFNIMISRVNDLTEKHLKSEITKKVMEMEILREQINPHFLYNSLSSIKWAIKNPAGKDLDSVIDSLVHFYRLCLNRGREIVSVRDELQIIRECISIQKFTYDAVYEIIWDMDEETYDYFCIKLILQPFVENAIIHGLNQKKADGCLKIGAYLENKKIYFVVEDNGQGFDTGILEEENLSGDDAVYKGFGIKNAIRRIKLTYGDRCNIDIKSTLGVGTRVTIEIPALTIEEINETLYKVFDTRHIVKVHSIN